MQERHKGTKARRHGGVGQLSELPPAGARWPDVVGQLCQLPPAARRAAPPRRAFTLVEIVVVISLILFLVGLILSVSTVVIERSEIRETEITIRLLDTALQEWEALADRQITWGRDNFPSPGPTYDLQGFWVTGRSDRDDVFIISELLNVIARASQVKDIIARINPEFVYKYKDTSDHPAWLEPSEYASQDDFVGSLVILDAWDQPIYPTHPGPLSKDAGAYLLADEDGTGRIYNEREYGIARNRRICFVSAGPDGKFGVEGEFDSPADMAEAMRKARVNNIYSYQPMTPPEWDVP